MNQFKKNLLKNLFICSAVLLGISSFAYGSGEISAHFGKKFQTDGAWHFGADALYRISINENSSFGIGPRYRFYSKSASGSASVGDASISTSGKRNKHRVALLANYRFEMDALFLGPILGLDIWKHYSDNRNLSALRTGENANVNLDISSSEFLWNNFTAQIGVEVGYKITPNFLMKLEGGYDLLSFKKCSLSGSGSSTEDDTLDASGEFDCNSKFNGVYATIGVGYHF